MITWNRYLTGLSSTTVLLRELGVLAPGERLGSQRDADQNIRLVVLCPGTDSREHVVTDHPALEVVGTTDLGSTPGGAKTVMEHVDAVLAGWKRRREAEDLARKILYTEEDED